MALRRRRRNDAGRARRLSLAVIQALQAQYREYPAWTVQLHYDNLVALSEEDEARYKELLAAQRARRTSASDGRRGD